MCRVDCERALHGINCWYIVTKENISMALKPMTKLEHNASSELGCLEKYKPGNRAAGRGGGVTGTLFHRRNSCTLWQRQRELVIKHSPGKQCSRTQVGVFQDPGPRLESSRTYVGVFQDPSRSVPEPRTQVRVCFSWTFFLNSCGPFTSSDGLPCHKYWSNKTAHIDTYLNPELFWWWHCRLSFLCMWTRIVLCAMLIPHLRFERLYASEETTLREKEHVFA